MEWTDADFLRVAEEYHERLTEEPPPDPLDDDALVGWLRRALADQMDFTAAALVMGPAFYGFTEAGERKFVIDRDASGQWAVYPLDGHVPEPLRGLDFDH